MFFLPLFTRPLFFYLFLVQDSFDSSFLVHFFRVGDAIIGILGGWKICKWSFPENYDIFLERFCKIIINELIGQMWNNF